MGLTERHLFENEEPELTERQLEDALYERDEAYKSGYVKGRHDAAKDMLQDIRSVNDDKITNGLSALLESMNKNQCYACSNEFIETVNEFGSSIIQDAIDLIKMQRLDIEALKNTIRGMTEDLMAGYRISTEKEKTKPVKPKRDITGRMWRCGNCGQYVGYESNNPLHPNEFNNFCRNCGRPVLYESREET